MGWEGSNNLLSTYYATSALHTVSHLIPTTTPYTEIILAIFSDNWTQGRDTPNK